MAKNVNVRRAHVNEVHVDRVVVKGRRRRSSSASANRFQVFRRFVLGRLTALGRAINGLRAAINSLIGRVQLLEEQVGETVGRIAETRQFFQSRIGTTVSVTTDAGVVSGTITEVGTNYVRLTESDGDLVFIPLDEVNSTTI